MKPTLFILAAGMGSRYGGLKQMDALGPDGEAILDYSVFDAVKAGFGKIVFVIREDFADDFKRVVLKKYEGKVACELCYQSIDKVPAGCSYNPERSKPWGTNHAVLMGKDIIREPFGVINADDYYGPESFTILADFLRSKEGRKNEYCMVGYRVCNTLSENGSVSRGICETDGEGYLTGVVERTSIERKNGVVCFTEAGKDVEIDENAPVSMNMWGFTPEYFGYVEDAFKRFLAEKGGELKSEFYIPTLVDELIHKGIATCKVLDTPSKWFGVTYSNDRQDVVNRFAKLAEDGVYPRPLF